MKMTLAGVDHILTSAADFRTILRLLPAPACITDSTGHPLLVNQAMTDLLGQPALDRLTPQPGASLPQDGQPVETEHEVIDATGQPRTVLARRCLIRLGPDQPPLIVTTLSDITSYRVTQARLQMLAQNVDLLIQTDLSFRRRYVSPSVETMLGYSQQEFLALTLMDIVHPDDAHIITRATTSISVNNYAKTTRYRYRRKDGTYVRVESVSRQLTDGSGYIITVRDITHRLNVERRLENANRRLEILALQDGLTGLANRRRFDECLAAEMDRAARAETPLSLILIDVDHFKLFNDTYGHVNGDECLREIAAAVRDTLQRPTDLAARYGGEEIAVLLPQTDSGIAIAIAQSIRNAVRALDRDHVTSPRGIVTVSAGVATLHPTGPTTPGQPSPLVLAADHALYRAKEAGRDRVFNWVPAGTRAGLRDPAPERAPA